MKNRNVLYFVIGSVILLAAQFWLSSRYAKPAPQAQVQPIPAEAAKPQAPVAAPAPFPPPRPRSSPA